MEKKLTFDNELNEIFIDELEEELNQQDFCPRTQDDYLVEFYLSANMDDRTWKSYVEDIDGGDNFAEYCEYIFKILEEEEYFEN